MGVYRFKPGFRHGLEPVARALGRTPPDAVSALAVVFAAAAGVLLAFADQRPALYLALLPLLFLRIACNAIDGLLAQIQGTATRRGEVVNELSDRVSDVLVVGALWWNEDADRGLAVAVLVVTLLVSYVGILSKAVGSKRNYEGPFGKADRMLLLGLACIAAFAVPRFFSAVPAARVWTVALALFLGLGLATLAKRTLRAAQGGPHR